VAISANRATALEQGPQLDWQWVGDKDRHDDIVSAPFRRSRSGDPSCAAFATVSLRDLF
jgi:hypothetical protein